MSNWGLPTQVMIGNTAYDIYTDYRDILRIFAEFENPDHKSYEQLYIAQNLFYKDFADIPAKDHEAAALQMNWFIDLGQSSDDIRPVRLLDWEQDQQMIAADINKVAGTEIRALPYLGKELQF